MSGEPMRVYSLDVGQGDCTFIRPPGPDKFAVLFDCNDAYVAERFVADHGITKLTIVVSHLDLDHIRGLQPFMHWCLNDADVKISEVWIAKDRALQKDKSKLFRKLATYLVKLEEEKRITLRFPVTEQGLKTVIRADDGAWSVDVLLPGYGQQHFPAGVATRADPNSLSVVLRVCYAGTAILIGGDATLASWEHLDPAERVAGCIRIPHHGGRIDEGSSELSYKALYESIGATAALVSVGTNNRWEHPLELHLSAARRGGACRVLCTQLTPRCAADPQRHRVATLAAAGSVAYPYRHRSKPGDPKCTHHRDRSEVPCAGSIAAWIEADGSLQIAPGSSSEHSRFVQTVDALCLEEVATQGLVNLVGK